MGAPETLAFKKVLIANRGEIAVRVIRACHQAGIRAVAVYGDVDRSALHVRYADEAVALGASEPRRSYLDQQKIIDAAKRCGADAIHPGYGFLSENASFAQACRDAGITFIGPTPEVIRKMGDKIRARETVAASGMPLIPGHEHVTRERLLACAHEVGFPLMLKASAGGGGKGIRAVRSESELLAAFERAEGEAKNAFGDGTVYIEKLLEDPHHIEIQVFGDEHGNVVHLFERECSVQRRHQKVIEETPSPFVTPELRAAMGRAAAKSAKAMGYTGAGTFEFLVDRDRRFYFLEVNTRLQVEHAITEMVCGVDLVREQLRVASGLKLSFAQDALAQHGHAIEARVCAEDPDNSFLPSIGRVDTLALPGGPGVRLDSALYPGLEVSLHYDSLLAKLVCWGADREEARARMRQALSEFKIADLKTNLAWLGRLARHPDFVAGHYDTGLVARLAPPEPPEELVRAAAIAAAVVSHAEAGRAGPKAADGKKPGLDPWKAYGRRQGLRSRP